MAQEARAGFPLSLALPTAVLTLWATASSTGSLPCPGLSVPLAVASPLIPTQPVRVETRWMATPH